jgi:S1-C subfamily serine protease
MIVRTSRAGWALALAALTLAADRARAAQPALYRQVLRSTGLLLAAGRRPGKVSCGTCWVVDRPRRLVVTNWHVVRGQRQVDVYFPDYRNGKVVTSFTYYYRKRPAIPGRVLTASVPLDLAVVQLEVLPEEVVALRLARRPPRVGQIVYAVGNGLRAWGSLWRLRHARVLRVRYGVSRRRGGHVVRAHVIETPRNSRHGDSGGPVVNRLGQLVGVHSAGGRRVSTSIQVRDVRFLLRKIQRETARLPPRPARRASRRTRESKAPATPGALFRLLLQGDRTAALFQRPRQQGVALDKGGPLRRDVAVVEDRLHGTLRHAGLAVDALVRVDVQLRLVLVEAVARTDRHAVGVLAVPTRFAHDERHRLPPVDESCLGRLPLTHARCRSGVRRHSRRSSLPGRDLRA